MTSVTALHPSFHHSQPVPAGQPVHENLPATGTSSAQSDPVPRGEVISTLNFFHETPDGSNPFNYVEKQPEGQPQNNYTTQDAQVTFHDTRGREDDFYLDKHAFQLLRGYPHNPSINWDDDESIKSVYYPEVECILKEHAGAKRVLLFDHTIRRAAGNAPRAPVIRAHIDQTPKSTKARVYHHLPEEADELIKGRYRIINVWRPLNGAVESSPLAMADTSTVQDEDLVPIEHRYPDRTGETAGVKHNPNSTWYYWSGMDNDERLLLQCADSDNWSTRVPHSAFVDPRNAEESKPRESIEVRALVFS